MTWDDIKRKLTSRKFWAAVVSFVSAILVFQGTAEGTAESIGALIWAGASLVAYIIGEGLVDAKAAGSSKGTAVSNTVYQLPAGNTTTTTTTETEGTEKKVTDDED